MDIISVYAKLLSESILSLYPIFVKKINLSIDIQLWTRLITYVLMALFFINYTWISNNLFTREALLLSFVNLAHVYFSYEGFLNLDSGVSFSIFNIYPLLILLFGGVSWKIEYFICICGLICFILSNYYSQNKSINYDNNFYYGFVMIILAAITEAIIYFVIKNIKTENNWNHMFIAYFFGSIIMSIYVFKEYYLKNNIEIFSEIEEKKNKTDKDKDKNNNFSIILLAIVINGLFGAIGYWLRFYSIYRLDSSIYAILSFFGIIMAYIYGIIFANESINFYKILGTILIILSNYLVEKNY